MITCKKHRRPILYPCGSYIQTAVSEHSLGNSHCVSHIGYLSQLKHLDMNAIVLGKHARLPSFRKLKPLGVWKLKNATNCIHYVILSMYICDFRLLFYSSIYSVYSSCFSQINLMKTGIGQSKYCIP